MCGPVPPAETELATGGVVLAADIAAVGEESCVLTVPGRLHLELADDDGCTVVMRGSRVLGPGPKAMGIAMEVGPEWTAHVARVQREYLQRRA